MLRVPFAGSALPQHLDDRRALNVRQGRRLLGRITSIFGPSYRATAEDGGPPVCSAGAV